MIPIYEQGTGRGIGHSLKSFMTRFELLCQEHLCDGRASAFAFVFYDFDDEELRHLLRDQGVFTKLDRLSGVNLSLFYLHAGRRRTVERFNAEFLDRLGVDGGTRLPCVVFFRVKEDKIEDVTVAELENANLIHGFRELYGVVESYIKDDLREQTSGPKYMRILKSGVRFVGIESFRILLRSALDSVIP